MSTTVSSKQGLSHADLLALRRLNTPTIYNGWEQITRRDVARDGFNVEPTTDMMPHMGAMVGYAVTAVIEPSNARHRVDLPNGARDYYRYVASIPGPKVVVVQDLDKPKLIGSFWGEVNSSIHKALGCVGTIVDGAVRDLDEMKHVGFKALARGTCIGHAHSWLVRWGCEVEVFGRRVEPGQLIHADQHGFLAVPQEDESRLLEAARFMDDNELQTYIPFIRHAAGMSLDEILAGLDRQGQQFSAAVKQKFGRKGEH